MTPLLFPPALFAWYDENRRILPWRAPPGERADPYRVLLSELMLQQTTVATVIPYFRRFLERFPTLAALAGAQEEEVLALWSGLGYYARARNLWRLARRLGPMGALPADESALRALPGIGPYTAAALAAIAFGLPAVPVDGNVRRVIARLHALERTGRALEAEVRRIAARAAHEPLFQRRPGDGVQALFDLGALICTPRAPRCPLCPQRSACRAAQTGRAAALPPPKAKPERPGRFGLHFLARDREGRILLRRRAPEGLLGGLWELPGAPWRDHPYGTDEAPLHAPFPAAWRPAGEVRHGFTHFRLTLLVMTADVRVFPQAILAPPFMAHETEGLARLALSSVMRKCLALGGRTAPAPPSDGERRREGGVT